MCSQEQQISTNNQSIGKSFAITLAFVTALSVSIQAEAGGVRLNFSDPDVTVTGVKQCPGANGCSFEVNAIDFSVDAYVCPNGSILYPDHTSTPAGCYNGLAHFDNGISFSSLGQLTDCTKNGSCKIKIIDLFLLTDVSTTINEQIPGNGQSVATFQDTNETCPALRISAMTVSINGFVCAAGVTSDGQCIGGNLGSYFNGIGVFNPLFNSIDPTDDLCMHINVTTPTQQDCYDGTAPYSCATTYP